LVDFDPQQHFTKPPPRYTEASLIKELEVQGIGRPSTYATILSVLQHRDYVENQNPAAAHRNGHGGERPLVENFPDVLDPKFTAHMEEDLDRIADGQASWLDIMREFYGPFAQELAAAKGRMARVKTLSTGIPCPKCGQELWIRWGKAGEFLGCSAHPDCDFTSDIERDAQGDIVPPVLSSSRGQAGPSGLSCPECGKELVVRRGRNGEFLGCSGYPKCRFTRNFTWGPEGKPVIAEPSATTGDFPCPEPNCQGTLVKRRSRRGFFYGCSQYPQCSFTLNQPPVEGPCPQCSFPWLRKKGKKLVCPKPDCGYEETAPADAAVSG
jgi:DNA topoisomerase I